MLYLLIALSAVYWLLPQQTMLKRPQYHWGDLSRFRAGSRKTWLTLGGLIASAVAQVSPAILVAIGIAKWYGISPVITLLRLCMVLCIVLIAYASFSRRQGEDSVMTSRTA